MQTITVTLGSLIDTTLFEMEAAAERGRPVTLGTTISEVDNEFILSTGVAQVSDVIEFGSELVLVTARSDAQNPMYTVQRGYYGSIAVAHTIGALGITNPQFSRRRVAEAINRSFPRLESLGVHPVESAVIYRTEGKRQLVLPEDAREVLQIVYINSDTGRVVPIGAWNAYGTVDPTVSATGRLVHLPPFIADDDELHVVYQVPYEWTGEAFPSEAAQVKLPRGAQDLPASYAAAWLTSAREVSRQELDRSEEFGRTVPLTNGGGAGLVNAKWREFYRALDEARRIVAIDVPKYRPYIRAPRRIL
jgi:hypothetical protein